jgi:hypothetical protein
MNVWRSLITHDYSAESITTMFTPKLSHSQFMTQIVARDLIYNEILTKKQSEFNFFHPLTFNNIDVPHDIRVLQGKTLTNNTPVTKH